MTDSLIAVFLAKYPEAWPPKRVKTTLVALVHFEGRELGGVFVTERALKKLYSIPTVETERNTYLESLDDKLAAALSIEIVHKKLVQIGAATIKVIGVSGDFRNVEKRTDEEYLGLQPDKELVNKLMS